MKKTLQKIILAGAFCCAPALMAMNPQSSQEDQKHRSAQETSQSATADALIMLGLTVDPKYVPKTHALLAPVARLVLSYLHPQLAIHSVGYLTGGLGLPSSDCLKLENVGTTAQNTPIAFLKDRGYGIWTFDKRQLPHVRQLEGIRTALCLPDKNIALATEEALEISDSTDGRPITQVTPWGPHHWHIEAAQNMILATHPSVAEMAEPQNLVLARVQDPQGKYKIVFVPQVMGLASYFKACVDPQGKGIIATQLPSCVALHDAQTLKLCGKIDAPIKTERLVDVCTHPRDPSKMCALLVQQDCSTFKVIDLTDKTSREIPNPEPKKHFFDVQEGALGNSHSLFVAGKDNAVRLIDLTTGAAVKLAENPRAIRRLRISPDKSFLAVQDPDQLTVYAIEDVAAFIKQKLDEQARGSQANKS